MMFDYSFMSFLRDRDIKSNIDEKAGSFGYHPHRICQSLVME